MKVRSKGGGKEATMDTGYGGPLHNIGGGWGNGENLVSGGVEKGVG